MRTMNIFNWILRIAGVCALILGLSIWTFQLDVINIHMLFGLLVTLALLVISFLAALTRGVRVLGIVGIIYAFIIPTLGMSQEMLLTGNLHWLIQILHMLVGIGALALGGVTSWRYLRLRKAAPAVL